MKNKNATLTASQAGTLSAISKAEDTDYSTRNGSTWTQYTVIENPPASFTLKVSPSASGYLTPNYPWPSGIDPAPGAAGADAFYTVTATSVNIDFNNSTTKDGANHDNILIGQECTPTLSAPGYTLQNYQWTPNGDIFASFVVASDSSSAVENPVTAATLASATPSWYWKSSNETDDSGATLDGGTNMTCTAEVYAGSLHIGTVTATANLTVWHPYHNAHPPDVQDSMFIPSSTNPTDMTSAGAVDSNGSPTVSGIHTYAAVATPYLFTNSGDHSSEGNYFFGQLTNWDIYLYGAFGVVLEHSTTNGVFALDNQWPYGIILITFD